MRRALPADLFGRNSPWPNNVWVGVAVTAHNNADLTGGVAKVSDLNVYSVYPPPGSTIAVVQNPVDASAPAGSPITFSASFTNATIAGGFATALQWYVDDKPVSYGTEETLKFIVGPINDGSKVYCQGFVGAASINSATGTVTVVSTTQMAGLKYEVYPGKSREEAFRFNAGTASRVMPITEAEAPYDWADNYAARLSGYFTPPANGNYVFFVCADDEADLYLSTDESSSNLRPIAAQRGWAGRRSWITDGANTAPTQRRSDQFTPDGVNYPYMSGIPLVGGQKYFIMVPMNEGGGGDNVGVTYKTDLSALDPVDGDASVMTGTQLSMYLQLNTALTITQQPQPVTAWEGQSAKFTVAASTDGEITPAYQWQRNQADMPGKTAATLKMANASLADNGAKYRCVITIPGTALTQTSAEVLLTVKPSIWAAGNVNQEIWRDPNPGRDAVNNGTAGEPKTVKLISMFDQPDFADEYTQRLSTWFKPPQDGLYVFFLCSDDDSDLFLSTNEDPANKRRIARQGGWSGNRDWNGGTDLAERRSDQYNPGEFSAGIQLQAANYYYLEAVMHEGTGGDNLSAYFKIYDPANPPAPPANGTESNIRGAVANVKLPAPTTLEITQQPQDLTVEELWPATFTIAATTDGLYPPSYQWRRGSVAIAGATGTQYTFSTLYADNGAKFDCVVSMSGTALVKTSRVATLTVIADTVAPKVLGAGAIAKSDGTTIELGVEFSEKVDAATASAISSYTLSKGTVTKVRYYPYVGELTFDAVALEVTGLVNGDTVNVTVQNVKDVKLNTMAATTKSVKVNTNFRYGVTGGRELFLTPPGTTTSADFPDEAIALGDGGYMTLSSSVSHWDKYDEQTFVYEVLTGDFERVVRVAAQDPTANWARAGIMAREELQEGVDRATMATTASRNFNIRGNPLVRFDGNGANKAIECYTRRTVGGNYDWSAGGWGGTVVYPNMWFKVKRAGNTMSGEWSVDGGVTWSPGGSEVLTPDWNSSLLVGAFYAPELGNLGCPVSPGIGHSSKAIFRQLGAKVPLPPQTIVSRSGSNVVLTWSVGAELYSATEADGPWTPTGNTSGSLTVNPSVAGAKVFYRAYGLR